MKKLIFTLAMVTVIMAGIFSLSASAERYTEFPVAIRSQDSCYNLTNVSFTITDHHDTQMYTNFMELILTGQFDVKNSSIDLNVFLYDAAGNHIDTREMNVKGGEYYETYGHAYLVVPDTTASFEICAKNPAEVSDTYYYCKYRNVYAEDGRVMGIHDLLFPSYQRVGWHGEVTMFALDGRHIEVPYNQIAAYQSVGWYTQQDMLFMERIESFNYYFSIGDYLSAYITLEWAILDLEGTPRQQEIYAIMPSLIDAWRVESNSPVGIGYSDCYNGELSIDLINISYKEIKSFKIELDCYDENGVKLAPKYEYYYSDDAQFASMEHKNYEWDKGSVPEGAYSIENVRVTQVVFTDGTTWQI